jgi:hypothetical protein
MIDIIPDRTRGVEGSSAGSMDGYGFFDLFGDNVNSFWIWAYRSPFRYRQIIFRRGRFPSSSSMAVRLLAMFSLSFYLFIHSFSFSFFVIVLLRLSAITSSANPNCVTDYESTAYRLVVEVIIIIIA